MSLPESSSFSAMAMTGVVTVLTAASPAVEATIAERSTSLYPEVRYSAPNSGTEIFYGFKSTIRDPLLDYYQPRTELGLRLLSLRKKFLESGGKLMSWDEINEEASIRRGGVGSA